MPRVIPDYNARFAKPPRDAHDAHRPLRTDEDTDLIFSWRELRKVTQALTLRYERKLYMPLDLMARLAALVPPPRMHLTRYHGVFAPHSKLRAAVTPAGRGQGREAASSGGRGEAGHPAPLWP